MKIDGGKTARKLSAFLAAVVLYYAIHEGAHALYALAIGRFEKVIFLFPGIQVQADTQYMTTLQIGLFCLAGAAATLGTAYLLCLLAKTIAKIPSHTVRAVFYYVTFAFLFTDPIYLSLLCGLFGGGDMNGISLFLPAPAARLSFAAAGLVNLLVFLKHILPVYRAAFESHADKKRSGQAE